MKKQYVSILLCCVLLLTVTSGKTITMKDRKIVAGDGAAQYVIVIPANSNIKSLLNALGKEITRYVEAQTGVVLKVVTDDKPVEASPEITIGEVDRTDVVALQAELPENGFHILCSADGNVAIIGENNFSLAYAVDLFISDELILEDGVLTIKAGLDRSGILTLSAWEEAGATICNHQRCGVIKSVKGRSVSSSLKTVSDVYAVMPLSCEFSINRTRSIWNVAVADLGAMCLHNGKLYFFFGDTKGGACGKDWLYSNVVAYTTDFDYTNGIRFDGFLTDEKGKVKPVTNGVFLVNLEAGYEFTRIPTGAISLDGNLYMSFMSVAQWLGDDWICNYGGIMKSSDDGATWTQLDARWSGDSMFCQMAPVYNKADGYVYVVGITGGRLNPARMMRVPAINYEHFDAYEYLIGYGKDGTPIWQGGMTGLYSDFTLINNKVWEPCIQYNEYLNEWIITYKNENGLQLYTSKNVWGPYEFTAEIPYPHSVSAGYYGVFMHPVITRENGRKVAFLMSAMIPTTTKDGNFWQIMLMEMTLNKSN